MDEQTKRLQNIVAPLLAWYDLNARELPWRSHPTPYRVWVSEIMLQQTRVEAVKPYFERFLRELPDVAALANVPEEKLMKLWEGLGYYSRARNMRAAAVQMMEEHGGRLPASFEELLRLKGIGRYTAGAIASIAFGIRVPAVDGNVLRVTARLLADTGDIASPQVRAKREGQLAQILPERPGDFNQALMDLGATVCLPNGIPGCENCPLQGQCLAFEQGRTEELPVKAPKKPRRVEERTVFLLHDGEKIAVAKRTQKGLLSGLYGFLDCEGKLDEGQAARWLEEQGIAAVSLLPLGEAKHIFTHIEWQMRGYLARVEVRPEGFEWIDDLDEVALPGAYQFYKMKLREVCRR